MSIHREVRARAIERVSAELAREQGYPGWGDVPEEERAVLVDAATRYMVAADGDERWSWACSFGEPLAREFHETYEKLAPDFGYETREASAKPWEDVPEQNKDLMIAVCREILRRRAEEALPQRQDSLQAQLESVRYLAVKAGAYEAADAISGLLGRATLGEIATASVVDFARWIVRLDDPADADAVEERRKVTMTGIINRAHRALAQAGLGPKA